MNTFRVTARVRRSGGQPAAPKPVQRGGGDRAVCESCEWFQSSVDRCVHPKAGCFRSPARRQPWSNLRRCPESRW